MCAVPQNKICCEILCSWNNEPGATLVGLIFVFFGHYWTKHSSKSTSLIKMILWISKEMIKDYLPWKKNIQKASVVDEICSPRFLTILKWSRMNVGHYLEFGARGRYPFCRQPACAAGIISKGPCCNMVVEKVHFKIYPEVRENLERVKILMFRRCFEQFQDISDVITAQNKNLNKVENISK